MNHIPEKTATKQNLYIFMGKVQQINTRMLPSPGDCADLPVNSSLSRVEVESKRVTQLRRSSFWPVCSPATACRCQ